MREAKKHASHLRDDGRAASYQMGLMSIHEPCLQAYDRVTITSRSAARRPIHSPSAYNAAARMYSEAGQGRAGQGKKEYRGLNCNVPT